MNNDNEIREIEANIKEAKKIVDVGNALERLLLNKDFRTVVKTGYFEQEAIRLVHLKAAGHMQTPEFQASIIKQIDAIGALNDYFRTVTHNASMAGKAIESDEAVRDELQAEAL